MQNLKTYEEWNKLGYTVKYGERPVSKNNQKKGLFSEKQVVKKTIAKDDY